MRPESDKGLDEIIAAKGRPVGGRGGTACHNCKQEGHKAVDCTAPITCRSCGVEGHKAADCPTRPAGAASAGAASAGGLACYTCGGPHKAAECPAGGKGDGPKCFTCGGVGHRAADCPSGGGGGGGGGGTRVITVARRIFVGNLTYETTWQDLKDHFKAVGHVVHADIVKPGSGIVEFDTCDEAAQAILRLHDSNLNGRLVFVREDRDDEELALARQDGRGGAMRGSARGGGRRDEPYGRPAPRAGGWGSRSLTGATGGGRRVFVGNLSYDTDWKSLKDHFKTAGNVLHAEVLYAHGGGASKGCGVVEMATASDADTAVRTLHDSSLDGRLIFVREYRDE